MKILLTMNLPYLPIYGGANKINRTIAEGLAARGHTVEVVVPALGVPSRVTHAEFIAEVKAEGIEVVSDGKVDSFHLRGVTVHAVREPTQLRTSLIERVERFQPERVLLSSEDPSHNLLDALLKVCAERVVYLVHTVSFLPFGPQAFFPSAGRAKLIEQVGGIVAISNYVARYIEQWSGLQSDVIYWPCYGSAPFPRLGSFDGEFVTMVNPCAIKGISIFEALAQWLPEVKFAGVLTWGAVEEDRRALESLPNVELLEPTTDIERIFSRTRVLLVPSLWEESFGLTVVEALLRGIPVLASDIGGLPEAKLGTDFLLPVRPIERFTERLNENMLPLPIVPKQDIAPWRDALRRLLSEREFYERQSEISRDAAAKFVASLSLDPLEHLLNRRATKPPSAHQHVAPATPKANDAQPSQPNDSSHPAEQLPVGLDDLTPEQQSLLMLLLREKAAKQTDEQAPQSQQTQTIQPMPRDGKAPLSFAQQRLWFLDQFEPNSATYNIPAAVRLSGTLDVAALEQSFDETLRRHEILRTNFALIDDQPTQLIAATRKQSLPIIDLQSLPADQQEGEVRNYAQRQAQQPFDLTSDPLLRSVLLRLSPTEHVLLVTMHHIISDAWSMSILIREITQLYEAYARGQTSPLAPLTIQYADYAAWQRHWLTDERLEAELAYWKEQLKDAPPLLELPTDRPRPAVQSYRGASVELKIGKELTDEIREKSQEQGATLFMTLLAAFQVLLSKYSGADDVSVGTAIAGRNRAEVEGLIGFFVNTLVLRTRLDGNPDFRELLERVREMTLGAYAHQDVPFEKLVEELAPKREMSHAPLFQVMFTLQNAPRESLQLPGLTLAQVEVETGAAMFDLSLSIEETAQGLFGVWEYNADLFDAATVRRIAGHFQTLLENIVARPQQRVSELSLMEEAERVRLLWEWNETGEEFPLDKCLHELFEEQAARTPDASALIFEDERLTYRELNTRANRLAQHLISLGVGAEVSVGICMERSLEMVIALFAIMKAGGAYVPLEPDYPRERLSYMLKDADVRVLLTEQKFAGRLPEHAAQIVDIDAERDVISRQSERNPSSGVVAANLIYIIYTSGSTGRPKGVMVPHRGVCNCLLWMQQRHRLTETDRVLFKAPLGFDASVWELFWPLLLGAGVVVARAGEQRDSAYLVELIARQRVTTVHFVPSMFQVFLEEKGLESCDALTRVICGGEALPLATAERFYQRLNGELHNFYGPTETSIGSIDWTCHPNIKHRTVPIGRPIANTECYLLDANLQPVPLGVSGELYTGGVGVARGYLGLPALTAEKFIPHPFSREPGARLYKSGDMARRLSDGNIEFLGRVDHQVKLRGLRIELGEIETALGRHPSVRDVVVVVREDVPGDKRLVAYLVWQRGAAAMSNSEMRRFLKETLPDFMLPSAFVTLDEIPFTHNVKIDLRALPAPGETRLATDKSYAAPRTPTEELLASIWTKVLGVERVGIDDNFFELGGHSLLATQVMSRVRETFQVELPLRHLFESPTVTELARRIEQAGTPTHESDVPELKPLSHDHSRPLSFAQQRLWFLDQLVPGSPFYNMPVAVRLRGQLDPSALEQTLSEITRRHEVLRTNFPAIDGEPVQKIRPAARQALPIINLDSLPTDQQEGEVRDYAQRQAQQPFDLSSDPLLRTSLLRLSSTEHVLLVTMHHIISDAWSMSILIREITQLYEAYARGQTSPLAPLTIQYADYAAWQRMNLTDKRLEAELAYWKEQLKDAPPLLELPTDRPRPAVQSYRGASVELKIGKELTEEIREKSQEQGATLFMTLLAAFQVLLARYSNMTDIVVGTPVANRTRSEVEGVIGFFVNTLVMRVEVGEEATFEEVLGRVREASVGGYGHQEVPFEKLVEEIAPERRMSQTPIFQVMFALQHAAVETSQLEGLEVTLLDVENRLAKFDLTLMVNETARGLACSIEYSTDLFDATTIERMARHWERLLKGIVNNARESVWQLPLMSGEERRQLVEEWNETRSEYGRGRSVHEMFEEQAAQRGEATALVCGGKAWTYGEVNERANRLGRYLRKRGVGEEEIVGVMVERGVEMVVGWLGVMKAGGAYMPLDPSYPPERLAFMLNDTGVNILLTQERLVEKVSAHDIGVVCVDKDWDFIAHESAENLFNETDAESVAYVIYTSGSTGKPKGILIPHRAVTRLLCNTNYIELSAADRIAQASNASFDAATFEIWGALIHGAQLVIVSRETMLSPTEFAAEIRERGITVLFLTTALFNLLAREAPGSFGLIRCLLFGGEAVDAGRVREVIKDAPPERLLHVYGPTESTTFATWYRVESVPENAATIPIGRPISNTQAYILDRRLQPMPVGLPGELYLGGEGLAHGYLHRPELTAEKFIPDAFNTQPGARLYKTGDRARFLPDGNIEFLGRVDHQVKLRGFRVELEEIEAVLAEHPSVSEAVVTLREDVAGEKRLVAYVAAGGDADAAQLRGYLRQKLPEYMLPASFVSMEKLPLTPNGKVNRRALPVPDEADTTPDTNFIAPRNTLEFQLAQIWEEVLDVRPVGVADNFFDLGGHSLLAVRLMAQIRRRFGRDLPLDTLFKGATVESLAAIIGQEGLSAWSPLVAMQRAGSKSPFFCVHPAGGNIICYIALVHHLGLAQPFYALQARGLDGREQPLTRIEDMAAYYIDALQRVQPQGPYLLGGWSLGGVIAFEMARQLHAEGHEIALLALIDSGAPTPSNQQAETDEATLLAALALDFGLPISEEDLRRLNPDERLEYFLVQGRKRNVVPPDYDLLQARRLLYIYQTNVQAFRDYRPRPYPNRITLFRASETPVVTQDNSAHTSVSDAASGWSQLSSQPLDIHDVPGDHISMIAEPHVRVLATQLQRTLEASLAKAEVY